MKYCASAYVAKQALEFTGGVVPGVKSQSSPMLAVRSKIKYMSSAPIASVSEPIPVQATKPALPPAADEADDAAVAAVAPEPARPPVGPLPLAPPALAEPPEPAGIVARAATR